jgi:hypothetical protein
MYPRIVSLAFGAVLVASVGLKIPGLMRVSEGETHEILPGIAKVLEAHRFQVSQYQPDNDLAWVTGANDGCNLRVTAVAPQGWHRALVAQMASGSRLYYVFDGAIYQEQPILRTRAYHYWRKFARYFGLEPQERSVLAVLMSPSCESGPLAQVAQLSAE